jgi:SAM-dependent methyltransferase
MIFENSGKIIEYFEAKNINSHSMSYVRTHAKRFAYMLHEIKKIRASIKNQVTTLDIGPSFFTELYTVEFPNDILHTLGFDSEESRGGHFPREINYNKSFHSTYDLNDSRYSRPLPDNLPKFDIVIMAEVIEHLYTSPEIVLKCIKKTIKQNGYFIIQTPNAASLSKRMKLMFEGKNPYELIRTDYHNPGHFREYTEKELKNIFINLSLKINKFETTNYIKFDSKKGYIQKITRSLLFPGFRRYIFTILENE